MGRRFLNARNRLYRVLCPRVHFKYTGMAACLYELPRPLIVQRDEFENSKQGRIKNCRRRGAREDNIDDE